MNTSDLIKLWNDYGEVDKIFFHNPFENKSILAALPSKKFNSELLFYAFEFFNFVNPNFNLEESAMSFEDICIIQNDEIIHKNISIKAKNQEIIQRQNSYKIIQQDYASWEKSVQSVVNRIKNQEFKKLVLSQQVEIIAEQEFSSSAILLNLYLKNPKSFIFGHCKNGKTFLGASPELLVSKKDTNIQSYALAGTMAKDGKNDAKLGQELLLDKKNCKEHKIVLDKIQNDMEKLSSKVEIAETKLMELPNLFHLQTWINAQSKAKLLDFVKIMHPSPALGGYPKDIAMKLIGQYESHQRKQYGSPIGYVDKNGDGVFVVGIRSAYLEKNKITAFAGCGIVENSKPMDEYHEVENKLKTILEAI